MTGVRWIPVLVTADTTTMKPEQTELQELWQKIHTGCGSLLSEIDLMLDRFHTLIDIYCDRREEFPVGFDEFMFDLERSTKILTEMQDIAKSKISETSDG